MPDPPDPHAEQCLTTRETQCLQLLANGCSNDAISTELGIALSTVTMHLQNARRKLGAVTREQAIAIAISRGLISIG